MGASERTQVEKGQQRPCWEGQLLEDKQELGLGLERSIPGRRHGRCGPR